MRNGLTKKILSVMNNYIKSICVFLLFVGASLNVWGTDVRTVSNISSGSTYLIKAINSNTYYFVPPTKNDYGGTTITKASATVLTFTKESSSWYITFRRNGTLYYLTMSGDEDNGKVSVTTTKTSVTLGDITSYGQSYIKIGGGGSSHKYIRLNNSDKTKMGAYNDSDGKTDIYLETATSITLKIPNGDGTWETWTGCSQGDMTYANATSQMNCLYGYTANYANSWKAETISGTTSTKPTEIDYNTGSVTAGTTYYPVWVNTSGGTNYYQTDIACLLPVYYVYYHANAGEDVVTNMPSDNNDYETGDAVTVPSGASNTPTRSGYTFLGWSEDSEATTKDDDYDPGDVFYIGTTHTHLYAVWCKKLDESDDAELSYSDLTSSSVTILWTTVTGATRYNLTVYDDEMNMIEYNNLTSLSQNVTGLNINTHYQAYITARCDCGGDYNFNNSEDLEFTTLQRYTITYNANGGTGTTPTTQYRDHGASAITLSNGSGLSKEGHTLSRWDTNSGGTGTSYAKGASYSGNADLALFAVWAPAVYTITYKDQGGSAFSGEHEDGYPTTHTYNTSTTLKSATKTGYTFEGWFTTSGCTEGTDVTSLGATAYTSNITLYAKWTPNEISITLDANTSNGGATNGSAKIDFGTSATKTLTAATGAAGKTLLGYYDAPTDGNKVLETSGALAAANVTGYITDSKWSCATSATLHAQWSTDVYTVSFNMHEHGSTVGSQNIAHGGKVTEPTPAPSDPNYRFDGWYKEGTYDNVWNFSTETVTSHVTIHAKWTQLTYNKLVFGCVDIDLATEDGDPILVSSRNGINIMATKKLVVNTTNAINGHAIAFSGTDLKFYKKTTEAPIRYIELTNADAAHTLTVTGEDQEVYVSYNPTIASDNAVATPQISVSCDGFTQTFDDLVQVRNLPASMVIATKVGGSWYALPATMPGDRAVQPGVLVTVDETNKTAYGPSTLAYKIWPVTTVNSTNDRFGTASSYTPNALYADRVRFAGNDDDGLNSTTDANTLNLLTDITASNSVTAEPYEWKIATSDLDAYTLQADNGANTNYLDVYRPTSGGHQGKIVWATNGDYLSNEIHFFKLEEITPINIIPREWKANGLVFSIAADNQISLTAGEAKYGIGEAANTNVTSITRHSTGGYGLYEVALEDLTSHYGKTLTLRLKINGSDQYATTTIPIIVNANNSTKDDEPFSTLGLATKDYDVVVLSGKTLTTDAAVSGAFRFRNMYLYAGSTLENIANGNLSVYYLELRGGIKGIDHKSDLEQDVPHLMLGKKINSTTGANLDMIVNTTHSYALSVPFTVNLADVNYANSLNTSTGAAINGTLNSQFQVLEYDAEQRVSLNNGWKTITNASTNLIAGRGYIIQAKRPKGQPFAVLRFPLHMATAVTNWADNENGEVAKAAVPISAAGVGNDAVSDNNKAWNLIANPYMANVSYKGQDETEFVANFSVGKLTPTDVVPWDGKYQYTEDEGSNRAYVTIPNDWYTEFPQYRANNVTFEPFKNFFIQASGPGNVTFERSYRTVIAAMPAMRELQAQAVFDKPAYVDINIEHGNKTAQTGLTVDKNAKEGYQYGEDQNIFENKADLNYLKLYSIADEHYLVGNTLTPSEITELIPLEFYAPDTDGDYIFSMDEGSEADDFEEIILYDALLNRQTDLKNGDYTFSIGETGFVENRFYINLIPKKEDTATGLGDASGDRERPLKFIYHNKLYILRNGVIYDATGKKVK